MSAQEQPDVIILDLMMPGMSGFEVLHTLKANPRTEGIPVIVHTSKKIDAKEQKMLSQAVAIIPKENESRELAFEQFQSAFRKANVGFPPLSRQKQVDERSAVIQEL